MNITGVSKGWGDYVKELYDDIRGERPEIVEEL